MADTPQKFPASSASKGVLNEKKAKDISTNGEEHTDYIQEVQNEMELPATTFGRVENKLSPINSTRAQWQAKDVTKFRTKEDKTSLMQDYICSTETTTKVQKKGKGPHSPTTTLLKSTTEDLDGIHERRVDEKVKGGYTTLNETFREPIFQYPVTVTRQIIPKQVIDKKKETTEEVTPPQGGVDITIKDLDCQRSLKTTRSIKIGQPIELYKEIKFRFPSILLGWNMGDGFSPQQRRSWFSTNANVRDGFTKTITSKVEIALHKTKPEPTDRDKILQIIPKNLVHNGTLFNVNVPSVLCDGRTLRANTHSEDTYYGFAVESYAYGASTPSKTRYLQLVTAKEWVLIAETIVPWKYNTWRVEKTYIIPE